MRDEAHEAVYEALACPNQGGRRDVHLPPLVCALPSLLLGGALFPQQLAGLLDCLDRRSVPCLCCSPYDEQSKGEPIQKSFVLRHPTGVTLETGRSVAEKPTGANSQKNQIPSRVWGMLRHEKSC